MMILKDIMGQGLPKCKPVIDPKKPLKKQKLNDENKIVFSYSLLDTDNPYYNINGICDKGVLKVVELLKHISNIKINEFSSGAYNNGTLRIHIHPKKDEKDTHDWPDIFQKHPQLEDSFFQIRFGKSKGGIHGALVNDVFYIIWFDPHHWFYPDKKFGPKKKLDKPGDCCRNRDTIIEDKQDKIDELEKYIKELEELLEVKTEPQST